MHGARAFIEALAIVLGVAAVTSVLFQRLRQPIVLGYLLAGLVVGPHLPIPLVADPEIVHALSELGVILLMFSLGLEFSLRKLWQVGPTAGITAVIQCSLMIWLGLLVGAAFGWTRLEGLFAGAIIAISSTTIIAKAFDEQKIGGRLREIVVGVLIVEDLIAILLMALLTGIASGVGMNAASARRHPGEARRLPRRARRDRPVRGAAGGARGACGSARPEITLVTSVAICFGISLLAQQLRLLGRARRVPRGVARLRVGQGAPDRAAGGAAARSLRRGVLRLGGDDDRPEADRRARSALRSPRPGSRRQSEAPARSPAGGSRSRRWCSRCRS